MGKPTRPGTSEVLAALSRISAREGDFALARVRLQESLNAIATEGSLRAGAAALHLVAELAESLGQLDRAVEFYGASRRIQDRSQSPEESQRREERVGALDRLRERLGDERFEAAWSASRATPFPFEFYVDRALHWLDALPPLPPGAGRSQAASGDQADAPGTTAVLVSRTKEGSDTARDKLARRYMEPLRRFGHGRLPKEARGLMDTDDLVQVTVAKGMQRIQHIEAKRKGSFFAYLRQILVNIVRDEARRAVRKPNPIPLSDSVPSPAPSPLQEALGREVFETYLAALGKLPHKQRRAIELRIEDGLSYQQVADAIGCPTANAARMLVERGLKLLTKRMRER